MKFSSPFALAAIVHLACAAPVNTLPGDSKPYANFTIPSDAVGPGAPYPTGSDSSPSFFNELKKPHGSHFGFKADVYPSGTVPLYGGSQSTATGLVKRQEASGVVSGGSAPSYGYGGSFPSGGVLPGRGPGGQGPAPPNGGFGRSSVSGVGFSRPLPTATGGGFSFPGIYPTATGGFAKKRQEPTTAGSGFATVPSGGFGGQLSALPSALPSGGLGGGFGNGVGSALPTDTGALGGLGGSFPTGLGLGSGLAPAAASAA